MGWDIDWKGRTDEVLNLRMHTACNYLVTFCWIMLFQIPAFSHIYYFGIMLDVRIFFFQYKSPTFLETSVCIRFKKLYVKSIP